MLHAENSDGIGKVYIKKHLIALFIFFKILQFN